MNRICSLSLARAIAKVRAMDMAQKELLAQALFCQQPALLSACLVQKQMGVSMEKMDFLLNLILICFQAMQETGLKWPIISELDFERQMTRYVANIEFGADLDENLGAQVVQQYVDSHPEKELLAFVQSETALWLNRIEPESSDKFVMLTAGTVVNCIAYCANETG